MYYIWNRCSWIFLQWCMGKNCCSGFFFQIAPSSVFHNGTDTVYTVGSTPHSYQWDFWKFSLLLLLQFQYHGIIQMQVEDDTSPSRKGRKANIQVVSRGAQQHRSHPHRNILKPQKAGVAKGHVSTSGFSSPSNSISSAFRNAESFCFACISI